jgi:nitrate/nitrite-specific signal transduction histidine kinase
MAERDNVHRVSARGEELLEMLRRGRAFTEGLLSENERLRYQVVRHESETIQLRNALETGTAAAARENDLLRHRIAHLEQRFQEVEAESRDFASRYAEVSAENENLAYLYVASHRLHSTLEPSEVTEIIVEIMIDLVGADEFGLLLVDERTNELTPIRVEGSLMGYPAHMHVGEGIWGAAVRDGRAHYEERPAQGAPLAVIPLQIKGHSVGALVIMRLLHGKMHFDVLTKELLGLLAGHAATALMSSRLYSAVDRKLRTIESFMDLIKVRDAGVPEGNPARGRVR